MKEIDNEKGEEEPEPFTSEEILEGNLLKVKKIHVLNPSNILVLTQSRYSLIECTTEHIKLWYFANESLFSEEEILNLSVGQNVIVQRNGHSYYRGKITYPLNADNKYTVLLVDHTYTAMIESK